MKEGEWLGVTRAAERAHVSTRSILRWAASGVIEGAVRVGQTGMLRLPASSIDVLIRPAAARQQDEQPDQEGH
jgi:hypothetical protein